MTGPAADDDGVLLAVPNRPSALRPMSERLAEAARRMGLPGRVAFAIDLCANEAVANVVAYGFPGGGEHEILVRLARAADGVRLTVEDEGVPFDPVAAPLPDAPAGLEDARVGGWGLGLIRAHADRCEYERRDGRNRLTVVLAVPDGADGPAGQAGRSGDATNSPRSGSRVIDQ